VKKVNDLQRELATHVERRNAEMEEVHRNYEKWDAYAKKLKQHLNDAMERNALFESRAAGEASLRNKLSAELGSMNPGHPLLRLDVQEQTIAAAQAEQAQRQRQTEPAR
jgi:hypothetical protein